MSSLEPSIEERLKSIHSEMLRQGKLPSEDSLQGARDLFRSKFGPEILSSLDGPTLLQTMHAHGNKDSLVYWLEFKNDDDFPGMFFGSIAGGSAHKFGLFRRKDTNQWVTGGTRNEENISEAEAVGIARKHRDQLLAGIEALQGISDVSDFQYSALQKKLEQNAPDIYSLAWAHKYWHLLFPDRLDDFHNEAWQRYYLIKVLQLPPAEKGLYVCAGRFLEIANELGRPINHITAVLHECYGNPVRYWRVGTRLGAKDSIWSAMREGGYIAVGWDAIEDWSYIAGDKEWKEKIVQLLNTHYPNPPQIQSRKAGEIRHFLMDMAEGDIVLAAEGEQILGIGRIDGPYRWESTPPIGAPHRRNVKWLNFEKWKLPVSEGLQTTVYKLKKDEKNLLAIERKLLGAPPLEPPLPPPGPSRTAKRLEGIPGRVQSILERKGQVILYGPPGTGKTFWARRAAFDLAAANSFGKLFEQLSSEEKKKIQGSEGQPGLVRFCTFHPAYGYEDFLEGYRPVASNGQLAFERRDGIFKKICGDAHRAPKGDYFYLIIDEINRGDIPRIFGELLTLLELDKRGMSLTLPLSGESFSVPDNLFILGTMNTADRSIALLDTALRRRFGFIELLPDTNLLARAIVGGSIPLGPWLSSLNQRILEHLGRDGRNLQIGHAYLLDAGKPVSDFSKFVRILADDLIPLLEEYCYEDYSVMKRILGAGLVDEVKQCIREELFTSNRRDDLVQALIEPSPEITTSPDATETEGLAEESELADDEEPHT